MVAPALTARAETWTRLDLAWLTHPIEPNHGKALVTSRTESTTWSAELAIWDTGEAELTTIRLSDGRMVNKHYDLAGGADLERLLDELVALLEDARVPDAAVVAHLPPALS